MSRGIGRGVGVVAAVAIGVLAAGAAVAVGSNAHKPKPVKPAKAAKIAHRVARVGVHADVSLIRADGTTDAFAIDRGVVTASSATSVTLLRRDGKSVTLALDGSTRIRGRIQVGRSALLYSRGGTAFRVLAPRGQAPSVPATPVTPPAEHHGGVVHADVTVVRTDGSTDSRTFDRGQVTAASTSSVTLQRKDGKSVTLAIAATTRVRGRLVVGGNALVVSQAGTALTIYARGPRA